MKRNSRYIDLTPITQAFLPHVETRATRALLREVTGSDTLDPDDESYRDLGLYATFAVIGLIGGERLRTNGYVTVMIPVAFETGHFEVKMTMNHRPASHACITLSLATKALILDDQ